jgi:nanoRNase/pAp phosphatase (c-di-AMP/oligoRNAs hydrolase)
MDERLFARRSPITLADLAQLREAAGAGPVLILTHDNPDPDALASGKALAALLKSAWEIDSRLVYSGLVARAENRAMLSRLTPEWEHGDILTDLDQYSALALVDTQPGAGNNRFPADRTPQIVIDHHHPIREGIAGVRYVDVRTEIGATVTMLYQYLRAAAIELEPILATAIFYALKIDTRGLSRDTSPADEEAYVALLDHLDQHELARVEQAGLPRDYFRAFSAGLHAAHLCGQAVVARLGVMDRPDLAAEMADLLIRLESARAVLCQGVYQATVQLSLRTKPLDDDAGQLIQDVVGTLGKAGGHMSVAGGQVPLAGRDGDTVMAELEQRFLTVMGEAGKVIPLL